MRPPRPQMLPHERDAWRLFVAQRCGLDLGISRQRFLERRLWQHMAPAGLNTFSGYLEQVRNDDAEWRRLLESLINGETRFFRHPPSFEALSCVIQQRLDALPEGPQPSLRLWSAGCSSGQEPYSMAMVALDVAQAVGRAVDLQALGSDLRPSALEAARRGHYDDRQLSDVPSARLRRYFRPLEQRTADSKEGARVVDNTLRSVVRWGHWNVLQKGTYPQTPQDVIFCHNVLIYMASALREQVVRRLSDCLAPGGYLFLAPGEMPGMRLDGMQAVRFADCLAYRRTSTSSIPWISKP